MPKAKERNWDAVKHSSMVTDHTNDLYLRLRAGKTVGGDDKDYLIEHVIGLVDALGWRVDLLAKLMPSTSKEEPVASAPTLAPKVPEAEKKPGIFSRG